MSNQDNRILELQKTIKKRNRKVEKFTPITTCIFELYGQRVNINTLTENNLRIWYCTLHSISQHRYSKDIKLNGNTIEDYIRDISSLISIKKSKTELKETEMLEMKLNNLLSKPKLVELEIDKIEELLK